MALQGNQKLFLLLYSTQSFIKNHPQALERYVRSLAGAQEYLKDNNTQVKELVAKTFKYDNLYIDFIWPKLHFGLYLEQSLLLTLEGEGRYVIAKKLTDKTILPNFTEFIYADTLRKIKADAVTLY